MEESFVFRCPACEWDLTLPTQVAGRTGKCPKCESVIAIPSQDTTEFDLGDFEGSSGESTIDLPRTGGSAKPPPSDPPSETTDPPSEITNELQKLLEELDED